MRNDPILGPYTAGLERDPLSPLVLTPSRSATRADVEDLSRVALHRLRDALGAGSLPAGRAVMMCAPNGPSFLAALVALRRAGLAAILGDPVAPAEGRRLSAQRLGAAAILRCVAAWPSSENDWSAEPVPPVGEDGRHPDPPPSGTAIVKLTSGSTGVPRGIALTAESLAADDDALFATMGLREDDRLLSAIPFPHSYALSSLVAPCLRRGTPLVLPDEPGPYAPLVAARAAGATFFPTVPSYLAGILRVSEPPPLPESLRLIVSAGAPLSPETAAGFRERFGQPVHVFYGASECGGIAYDREGGAAERGTVGVPVEGVSVTLRGEEGSGSAREGVVTVSSPAVASCYLPLDAAPEAAGEEMSSPSLRAGSFVSGDVGAWRGGELALVGRREDFINVHGRKVNPREVEAVIAAMEGVREVAVLGLPAPGRGAQAIRAVVAGEPGAVCHESVVAWCRSRLPGWKVPRSVLVVGELPRTSRGKLDRAALAEVRPEGRGTT